MYIGFVRNSSSKLIAEMMSQCLLLTIESYFLVFMISFIPSALALGMTQWALLAKKLIVNMIQVGPCNLLLQDIILETSVMNEISCSQDSHDVKMP